MSEGPERRVEKRLVMKVRAAGGMCLKMAPTQAGMPDRLVLLPGGRFFLVELKSPRGRLRPIQVVWHQRAAKLGHPVVVLNSTRRVDEWLEGLTRS